MDFDATSLYHSAVWDEKSVYPKIESVFAFKPQMNETYEDAFNKVLTKTVMNLLY